MHESSFGEWLRQHRRMLDLTKQALAEQVGCSAATIAKIEANLRRPSQQVALRLAKSLAIPAAEHATFVRWSRGVREQPAVLPISSESRYPALPVPLTPLLGRETELATLVAQVSGSARLFTLTGAPGVGKTRLALAVAQVAAKQFATNTAFVALAAVRDPALLGDALVQALTILPEAGRSAFERIAEALRTERLILVLDNFEQIVAAAPLLAELLTHCPGVTAIVTSRERLHVRGEQHIRVAPLALPTFSQKLKLEQIAQSPAVALFAQVAQAAQATFRLTNANALAVATICAHADGLPLAIEIIAAQSDTLAPAEILAQIEHDRLTSSTLRDLPERQQTMQATLDWSYRLLHEREQRLFRAVGVFAGTWSLGAAETVANDNAVSATLMALVHKSLVQQTAQSHGEAHFSLLETVRRYALEQLTHSGEGCELRNRHAAYYRSLAAQAAPHLKAGSQTVWIERLGADNANLTLALDWLIAGGEYEQAGAMCNHLRRFWWISGRWQEGRSWAAQVLAHAAALTPLTHAYVQVANGALAAVEGDTVAAVSAFETALALAQHTEDRELVGIAAHNLGSVLLTQGKRERARTLFEIGLAIDREVADSWGLAISLGSLGELACSTGDYSAAYAYYQESLTIFRTCEDYGSIAIALNNLGEVLRIQGQLAAAHTHFTEGLALARQHRLERILPTLFNNLGLIAVAHGELALARTWLREAVVPQLAGSSILDSATSLCIGGLLMLAEDRYADAVNVLGAAQSLCSSHAVALPPSDQAAFDHAVSRVQAQLDPTTFAYHWSAGERCSLREAMALLQNFVQ